MNWKRIPKEKTDAPTKGSYRDWKDILADEGFNHCVYCTTHEGSFGRRNYHVEHYKPKGLSEFKHLENDFNNLYFACCVCNCFKGEFWEEPTEDHAVSAFPDPSKVDYSCLFSIDNNAWIKGKNVTGRFIVEKLYLNRPQLLLERRLELALERLNSYIEAFKKLKGQLFERAYYDLDAVPLLARVTEIYERLNLIQTKIRKTVPYTSADLKKPNNN